MAAVVVRRFLAVQMRRSITVPTKTAQSGTNVSVSSSSSSSSSKSPVGGRTRATAAIRIVITEKEELFS